MCLKICSSCKLPKDHLEFNKKARFKDGLDKVCKSCTSKRRKELKSNHLSRIKTELHKIVLVENRILKADDLSRCHNPECRAKLPLNKSNHYCYDCQKAQREKNKEKVLAQKKAYRDRNKDKQKAYNESRKESMREYCALRYIQKKDKIREQQRQAYLKRKEILKAKGKISFKDINIAIGTASNGGGVASATLSLNKTEPIVMTKEHYELLKKWLNNTKECKYLKKEYEELRRPFNNKFRHDDVLMYAQEVNITGKYNHPTQKPPKLSRALIETSTDKDSLVYIPFGGSGVEAEQCESLQQGGLF